LLLHRKAEKGKKHTSQNHTLFCQQALEQSSDVPRGGSASPTMILKCLKKLGIQNNKFNKHLSFHRDKLQLLCDSNHFHSQII